MIDGFLDDARAVGVVADVGGDRVSVELRQLVGPPRGGDDADACLGGALRDRSSDSGGRADDENPLSLELLHSFPLVVGSNVATLGHRRKPASDGALESEW